MRPFFCTWDSTYACQSQRDHSPQQRVSGTRYASVAPLFDLHLSARCVKQALEDETTKLKKLLPEAMLDSLTLQFK